MLEKRKPDLRAVNRAGQSLIRQLDSPDDIEKQLDELSDRYYVVADKTKDKLHNVKETVQKVKIYIQVIEVLEIWIEEIIIIVDKFDTCGTDPETVKRQLEHVQVNLFFRQTYRICSYICLTLTYKKKDCVLNICSQQCGILGTNDYHFV